MNKVKKYSKLANFDKSENAKQFHKEKLELESKLVNVLQKSQIPWLYIPERYRVKGHLPKGFVNNLLEAVVDMLSITPVFKEDATDTDFFRNYLRMDLTAENKQVADNSLKRNPEFKEIVTDILEFQGIVDVEELYQNFSAAYWLLEIKRHLNDTERVDFWKYKEEPYYEEADVLENPNLLIEEQFYIANEEAIVEYSSDTCFIVRPLTVAAFNFYRTGSWLRENYFSENIFMVLEPGDAATGFLIDVENNVWVDRGADTYHPKYVLDNNPEVAEVLKQKYVNPEFYSALNSVYDHTEKGFAIPLEYLSDITDESETTFDKISQGEMPFDNDYLEPLSDIVRYHKIDESNSKIIMDYLQKNFAEEIQELDESEIFDFIEEYVEDVSMAIREAYSDAYRDAQESKYLQAVLSACNDYFPFDFTGYYTGSHVIMSDKQVEEYWYAFVPVTWLKKLRKNQHYEIILSTVEEPISADDISDTAAHASEYASVKDEYFNEALSNRLYDLS